MDETKIRKQVWYRRWASYLKKANTQDSGIIVEDPEKFLKLLFDAIEEIHGFRYDHIATAAFKSLRQVVKDIDPLKRFIEFGEKIGSSKSPHKKWD